MQAELPDKNTAFIVYRREAISSLKSKRFDGCIGALYSLMGLLPDTYRPTLSTEQFELLTTQNLFAICTECQTQNNFAQVKTHQRYLPFLSSVVTGKSTEEVWTCPQCNSHNSLHSTKYIQQVLKEPYFVKILPSPPNRKSGMLGRTSFDTKFSNWFWLALSCIEAQMGRYREEYQPKDTDLFDMESQIADAGENLE